LPGDGVGQSRVMAGMFLPREGGENSVGLVLAKKLIRKVKLGEEGGTSNGRFRDGGEGVSKGRDHGILLGPTGREGVGVKKGSGALTVRREKAISPRGSYRYGGREWGRVWGDGGD